MKKAFKRICALIVLTLILVSATGCGLFYETRGDITKLENSAVAGQGVTFSTKSDNERLLLTKVEVAEKVKRSVVAISVSYTSAASQSVVYGSGVIVDIDESSLGEGEYYILTCHHLISSGGDITVYVPDANSRNFTDSDYDNTYVFNGVISDKITDGEITLVGGDKDSDIAVLKLDVKGKDVDIDVCPAPADGYVAKVGEDILTIGNPKGVLPMSVHDGIISYIGRTVSLSGIGEMMLLQISADTTHGSSGGALFNMYGELIGITNAGRDDVSGINYAIPFFGDNGFINIAKSLIGTKALYANNYGYVTGRWNLGITVEEKVLGNQSTCVQIKTVTPNSNAYGESEENRLYEGDIIWAVKYTTVGGEQKTIDVNNLSSLDDAISQLKKNLKLGGSFTFVVARDFTNYVDVVIKITKQLIFCDTGDYTQAN